MQLQSLQLAQEQAQQQVQQKALRHVGLHELVKMPSLNRNVALVGAGACAATTFGFTLAAPPTQAPSAQETN